MVEQGWLWGRVWLMECGVCLRVTDEQVEEIVRLVFSASFVVEV